MWLPNRLFLSLIEKQQVERGLLRMGDSRQRKSEYISVR
jgi:hypothetical protein